MIKCFLQAASVPDTVGAHQPGVHVLPWKCQWTSPVKCVADGKLESNYANGSVRIVEKRRCVHFGLDTLFGTFNRKAAFQMWQLTATLLPPRPPPHPEARLLKTSHWASLWDTGTRGTRLWGEGRLQPVRQLSPPRTWSSPRCWHHLLDNGATCADPLCPIAS